MVIFMIEYHRIVICLKKKAQTALLCDNPLINIAIIMIVVIIVIIL